MKRVIIFLGIPGSGKGTQARALAQKYGYAHISTGDLLRSLERNLGISAKDKEELKKMKAGGVVGDDLIYRLAFSEIESQITTGKGIVLDGAIRNVSQAEHYQRFFESWGIANEVQVIELNMRDEVSFDRMYSRQHDAQGVTRSDDTVDALKERLKLQGNEALLEIKNYYKAKNVLCSVDAEESIDEVLSAIERVIERP